MNVNNIRTNLAWMWIAVINVRPLLIRWGVIYLTLIAVYSAWTVSTVIFKNNIARSEQAALAQARKDSLGKRIKLTANTLQQKSIILPASPAEITPPPVAPPAASASKVAASNSGNTYTAGNCTWYVKSKRPDLPNNLGNANTWASRARAQGLPTGTEPRVGAVGQKGTHVLFVESVNTDGTMHISEMNFIGLSKRSERIVDTSGYQFIY